MSNSTITIQSLANFASTHADLLPLTGVGGYTNEPALSIFNDALSEILTSPNDWKWNSIELGLLVTARNKQDYVFAGATAFTLGATSTGAAIGLGTNSAIAVSGGVVTVTMLEAHRFSVGDTVYLTGVTMTVGTTAKYNSTFTDDGTQSSWSGGWVIASVPTSTTFTFAATSGQNNSDAGGAPGITNYGWLPSASMVQMNNNSSPQQINYLQAVKDLPPRSQVANPEKVSIYRDNGDGTVVVRFAFVPGSTIWGVKMLIQAKAPLKTDMSQTISPFPDHYSFVLRQAFLYRLYRYLNSPRAEIEYQKLQADINKAQGADDAESSDIYVCPETSLTDGSQYWSF